MSQIETFLITWIPVFVVLSIAVIGLLKYASIRSRYKVTQLKQGKIGFIGAGTIYKADNSWNV